MQRDIHTNEIDWVFCWRTSTGEVRAGARDTHMNGARVLYQPSASRPDTGLLFCRDREGHVIDTLEADFVFDDAPLPAFAEAWRSTGNAEQEGGGVMEIAYPRPTGRGAWERWVKAEDERPS